MCAMTIKLRIVTITRSYASDATYYHVFGATECFRLIRSLHVAVRSREFRTETFRTPPSKMFRETPFKPCSCRRTTPKPPKTCARKRSAIASPRFTDFLKVYDYCCFRSIVGRRIFNMKSRKIAVCIICVCVLHGSLCTRSSHTPFIDVSGYLLLCFLSSYFI